MRVPSAGGAAVAVNTDAGNDFKEVVGLHLYNMNLVGGSAGVVFGKLNSARTVAWSSVTDCTVGNGLFFFGADGEISRNNVSFGDNPAHVFNIVEGGFFCGVFGGTSSNKKGGVDIRNGSHVKIHGLQCEYGNENVGVSDQAYGAQAIVRGYDYHSIATQFHQS